MIEQLSIDGVLQKLKQKIPPRFQRMLDRARSVLRKNLLQSMAITAIVSGISMLIIFLGIREVNSEYSQNTPVQLQLTRDASTLMLDDQGFTSNLLLLLYTLDLRYKESYKEAEPVSIAVQKRLIANITPDLQKTIQELGESAKILFEIENKAMKFADRALQTSDKAKAQAEVQKGLALMNSQTYLENKQIFKNAALEGIANVQNKTSARIKERGGHLNLLVLIAAGNFIFLSLMWLGQWSVTNDTMIDNKRNKIAITDADARIRANNAYLVEELGKQKTAVITSYEQEVGLIVTKIEEYTNGNLTRTKDSDMNAASDLVLIVFELNRFVDKLNAILWAVDRSISKIDKQHSEQLKLISNTQTASSGLRDHLKELNTLHDRSDCFDQIDRAKENRSLASLLALIATARPTIDAAADRATKLNQSSKAISDAIRQIKSLSIDSQQALLAARDESTETELCAVKAQLIGKRDSSEAALELELTANRLLKFATQNNGSIELLHGSQQQVDQAVNIINDELNNFIELTANLINDVDLTYGAVDEMGNLVADCKIHNQELLTATANLRTVTQMPPLIISSQARAKTIDASIGRIEAGSTLQKNNQIELNSLIGCFKSHRFPQKM